MIAAPPPGTPALELSGKLVAKDGKFLLTDSKSKQTFELRGEQLTRFAGMQVIVTGDALADAGSSADATKVVTVATITTPAGKRGAGAATAAGAKTGTGTAKIAAISAAAVVGGTVGGLYASGAIGDSQPASRP